MNPTLVRSSVTGSGSGRRGVSLTATTLAGGKERWLSVELERDIDPGNGRPWPERGDGGGKGLLVGDVRRRLPSLSNARGWPSRSTVSTVGRTPPRRFRSFLRLELLEELLLEVLLILEFLDKEPFFCKLA